jgi:Sulfotransferase family
MSISSLARHGGRVSSPVVVGGAGSGPRAVTEVLRVCGLHLPGPVDGQLDSEWAALLLSRPSWVWLLLGSAAPRPAPDLLEAIDVLSAMCSGELLEPEQVAILASAAVEHAATAGHRAGQDRAGAGQDGAAAGQQAAAGHEVAAAGQEAAGRVVPAIGHDHAAGDEDRDEAQGDRRGAGMPFRIVAEYLDRASPEASHEPWGFKYAAADVLLPELLAAFGELRYIHVVRDPFDAAWSENREVVELWGRLGGIGPERLARSPQDAALGWWLRSTSQAVSAGRSIGGRFMLVRLEQLWQHPIAVARRLAEFAGLQPDQETLRLAITDITAPDSVGRYKQHGLEALDPALVARAQGWIDNWRGDRRDAADQRLSALS